jgi:hypothetical protein
MGKDSNTDILMNSEILTDENFIIFCAKHYDNINYCSTEDFLSDINRIKYVKKLITRYISSGDLRERIILNHIIILNNCFGVEVLNKILYLKLKDQFKYIKPFLILINSLSTSICNGSEVIYTDDIQIDNNIVQKLRLIVNG